MRGEAAEERRGAHAIRIDGGNVRDRADKGTERVERVSRRRFAGAAERPGSARSQRARADGSSVRQRESVVPEHAGNRRGRVTSAGKGVAPGIHPEICGGQLEAARGPQGEGGALVGRKDEILDRKSTRLNSSHVAISYAVFCLKKKRRKSNLTK